MFVTTYKCEKIISTCPGFPHLTVDTQNEFMRGEIKVLLMYNKVLFIQNEIILKYETYFNDGWF